MGTKTITISIIIINNTAIIISAKSATPHLARALSAPANYIKQLQLNTEFEETFGTSISQTREGARPARVKKLTEKGKDWAHSLNKNDLATFRIPHSPQSPNSMLLQMPS